MYASLCCIFIRARCFLYKLKKLPAGFPAYDLIGVRISIQLSAVFSSESAAIIYNLRLCGMQFRPVLPLSFHSVCSSHMFPSAAMDSEDFHHQNQYQCRATYIGLPSLRGRALISPCRASHPFAVRPGLIPLRIPPPVVPHGVPVQTRLGCGALIPAP